MDTGNFMSARVLKFGLCYVDIVCCLCISFQVIALANSIIVELSVSTTITARWVSGWSSAAVAPVTLDLQLSSLSSSIISDSDESLLSLNSLCNK